jgi:hypothetical protein
MEKTLRAAFALILLGGCGSSSTADISGVLEVTEVARLSGVEGSDSINPTWEANIGGVDLGHMVNHNGKTFFFYGDSFSSDLAYNPSIPGSGAGWRWNTCSYSTDPDFSDGVTFDGWITDTGGNAREIIHDDRNSPITNIPTGGLSLGNRIYVWYMSMKDWTNPWKNHFSGLAYSENDGQTFNIVSAFQFPNNESGGNFGMVSVCQRSDVSLGEDNHVYLWGTPANRYGGVKLARVDPGQVTNLGAYEYFNGMGGGEPTWTSSEFGAPLIVPARVSEMSVMYNEWAGRWIMLHGWNPGDLPDWNAGHIVLRQAPEPWGPWSDPIMVIDVSGPGGTGLPYGPYLNPLYVENRGETIYFILSKWTPYDVYLMKARLLKEGTSTVEDWGG